MVYMHFLTCMTHRIGGRSKGEFLRGQVQLQFSDNEGRQRISLEKKKSSRGYSLEPVCTTDLALKQCH